MLLLQQTSPERIIPVHQKTLSGYNLVTMSNQNLKQTIKLTATKSPTTLNTFSQSNLMRDSFTGSLSESIQNEKTTNKDELMRNLMPSQK